MRTAIQLIGLLVLGITQSPSNIEQTSPGPRPAPALAASFDGLGDGFTGPQGTATLRNPSDNSLAVGPDHVVQTVNSRMAIFTKAGRPLYGPVNTNNVFRGFGGACEERNNGDAVVRYDQLATRWLIVMPTFSRAAARPDQPPVWTASDKAYLSPPGRPCGPSSPTIRVPLCGPTDTVPTSTGDEVIEKHACVAQRDAQGDKLMARVVYRRIGNRESVVAVHSVNTAAGGGGVRWYEFRLDSRGTPALHQQSTFAPQHASTSAPSYRWLGSPAIDKFGNIGIGYSFGGTPHFAGQRFAGRLASDPPGQLSLREAVLVEGEAAQTTTLRWEDYTQTAIDPADDCTIWYVGDYVKKDAASYSSRIGAFRFPGCTP